MIYTKAKLTEKQVLERLSGLRALRQTWDMHPPKNPWRQTDYLKKLDQRIHRQHKRAENGF